LQTIITAPRLFPCLALTASVCVPPDAAAEFIDMSERKERLVRTLAADDDANSRVNVDLLLFSNDVASEDVNVWLVTDSGRTRLPVDAEGVIDVSEHEATLADMTGFEVDPYEEGFGFGARMTPRLPLTPAVDPTLVRDSVDELNALIKREAGMLSLLAPRMKGIRARLGPGESVALATGSGQAKTLPADEEGWVEVTWKLKSLERIEFSSAPLRYDFVN
jgi:hypothetical protein